MFALKQTSRGIGEQIDAPQTIRLWSLANLEDGFGAVHAFEGPKTRITGSNIVITPYAILQ
jgi:hypothetical protein